MRGGGARIELIRFGLLIVLTIALASVAFRIDSKSSSDSSQSSRPHAPASATPSPASSSPQVLPTASTRPAAPKPRATGSAGTGAGGTGAGASSQELPVTGRDSTVRLVGLALVLIGGGTLTVRLAGPSPAARRRQRLADTVQD